MGLSSRAAGRSCWTSGSVSVANSSSRVSVARDSRRKVGKIWNVSASSALRLAVVVKTSFEFSISPRSWPRRSESAVKTSPPSRISRWTASRCAVEQAESVVGLLGERVEAGERQRQVVAAAAQRRRLALHPGLERVAGRVVEGPEDLVELDRVGDLRLGQGPALRDRARRLARTGPSRTRPSRRGQLDVGLAEEGLLSQHRPGVHRDRRVLRVVSRARPPPVPGRPARSTSPFRPISPEMRTSDSVASCRGLLERHRDP